MEFKCINCGEERLTNQTIYRCPKCKSMQPIDDYKDAFENLFELYEEEKRSAGKYLGIMHRANESYKKERNFFIITTVICFIATIVQLLI